MILAEMKEVRRGKNAKDKQNKDRKTLNRANFINSVAFKRDEKLPSSTFSSSTKNMFILILFFSQTLQIFFSLIFRLSKIGGINVT